MFKETRLLVPIILACAIGVYSQISIVEANEVFAQIPSEQRATLTEQLNLFIQLEKKGKWDESYKMISNTFKQSFQSGYPLKNYKEDKNIKIKKFISQHLTPVTGETVYTAQPFEERKGHFFLGGCGKFNSGGAFREVLIEAYWENGDWYFSFMQLLGFEGGKACRYKKRK